MPANTVNVARPGKWGNPFIVGVHGTQLQCFELFLALCHGYLCISIDRACIKRQEAFHAYAKEHLNELRGKNLACWCAKDKPCHADILLRMVNGGS